MVIRTFTAFQYKYKYSNMLNCFLNHKSMQYALKGFFENRKAAVLRIGCL